MPLNLLWLTIIAVVSATGSANGAVIRHVSVPISPDHKSHEALIVEPQPTTTTAIDLSSDEDTEASTTLRPIVEEQTVAHSRDEDASVQIAPASLDPAPGTVEGIEITLETVEAKNENEAIEKRLEAEEKRLEEEEAQLDMEMSEDLEQALDLNEEQLKNTELLGQPAKSAKLLLLSTPRFTREQEENIEEPAELENATDLNSDVTTEVTTELQSETMPTTTESEQKNQDEKKTDETPEKTENENKKSDSEESFITRLFGVKDAIFGSNTEATKDEKTIQRQPETPENENSTEKNVQGKITDKGNDESNNVTAEQTAEPHNDNVASAILVETEPDYVVVDTDVEELGSFTHAESAEHLQPIIHSVEVVPTYFNEPLLVGYVHPW